MALMPSEGIMSAPMPNSNTSGATFVISPGTSEPRAPTMEAAADMGDWRACVAVDEDDLLLVLLCDEAGELDDDSTALVMEINANSSARQANVTNFFSSIVIAFSAVSLAGFLDSSGNWRSLD